MMKSLNKHRDRNGREYWVAVGDMNGRPTVVEGDTKLEAKVEWAKMYYDFVNTEDMYGYKDPKHR